MENITVKEWVNKFNNKEFESKTEQFSVMQVGMIGFVQMMH